MSTRGAYITLCALCDEVGLPRPEREWEFSHTNHRADYAWPDYSLALEVDGGAWVNGRHNRPAHTEDEQRKRNEYALQGWRVIYTTPRNLLKVETMDLIRRALYA